MLGQNVNELIQNVALQRIYIEDIVKIFLIDNLLNPAYLKIVIIIIE
jgi:hypothetical protein